MDCLLRTHLYNRLSSFTRYTIAGKEKKEKVVNFINQKTAAAPNTANTQDTPDAIPTSTSTSTPSPVSPQSNTSSGSLINDLAQPEGAKEARDSHADITSAENPPENTHYQSKSEIEERICMQMQAIKAAKGAKDGKDAD